MQLPTFSPKCKVVKIGDLDYLEHQYQYSYTSNPITRMSPGAIIYPTGDDDIIKAINFARENKIKIAIRTGGHQYCGASSTSSQNIQLDLSETYKEFQWIQEDKKIVGIRAGISYPLVEINALLGSQGVFVPHGQCSHVHLGGHVQSGGYGNLGRSHGLFCDHVQSFDIITADGQKRTVVKGVPKDKDLFYAVLGGSPGNFGVLTHITLKVYPDSDYPDSRGLKSLMFYTEEKLKELLDIVAELETKPADYDLCVTMLSADILPAIFPECGNIDELMRINHKEFYGHDALPGWPPMLVVYAQWANLDKSKVFGKEEEAWFARLNKVGFNLALGLQNEKRYTPMSKLTKAWIFGNVREFPQPYVKRSYVTKGPAPEGWTSWAAGRVEEIQNASNGCKLSIQIQNFGGAQSKYRIQGSGPDCPTSHSWRSDATVVAVMDCFYDRSSTRAQGIAENWQKENDLQAVGKDGKLCVEDRRFWWGSFDSEVRPTTWKSYYEEPIYRRVLAIKKAVDPTGVFTPNQYCIDQLAQPTSSLTVAHRSVAPPPTPTEDWIQPLGIDRYFAKKLGTKRHILGSNETVHAHPDPKARGPLPPRSRL